MSRTTETSRSPYTVSASVRGIGVAVITSTSGIRPFDRSVARCTTPKRCCSSMMASPSEWKFTVPCTSACVPTMRSIAPADSRASRSRRRSPVVAPVMSSTRKRDFSSSFRRLRKCCSARISVGAMNATCSPFSMATRAASRATIVLPAPTSPCSRRFIGVLRCMSSTISFSAPRCPSVSLNGRIARADSRIRSSTWMTRGFDSRTAARLRIIKPSWNRKNSSKITRTCAGVLKLFN